MQLGDAEGGGDLGDGRPSLARRTKVSYWLISSGSRRAMFSMSEASSARRIVARLHDGAGQGRDLAALRLARPWRQK